jgi:hypothetical protein
MLLTLAVTMSLSLAAKTEAPEDPGFGSIASAVGDIDSDGIEDYAVGSTHSRVVRVISGRDGTNLMSLTLPAGEHWVADRVASLGDVDGDGHADLLLSFAGVGTGSEVSVWSSRDGHRLYAVAGGCALVIHDRDGDGVSDFVMTSIPASENGSASRLDLTWRSGKDGSSITTSAVALSERPTNPVLSSVGDVDGDGVADVGLVSGAEAIVLSGKDGDVLQRFGARNGRKPKALTGGIDFDGDHYADVLIGYPNEPDEDAGKGLVVARSGYGGRELFTLEAEGGLFGFAICILGDVDGDGFSDFVVGSHGESFVDPLRAFSGGSRKLLWKIDGDFDLDCHRIPMLSALADQDHDGARDLLVGCPAMGGRCMKAGYAMVVSGKTGEKLHRTKPTTATAADPAEKSR